MKRLALACVVLFGLAAVSATALAETKAQSKPTQAPATKAAPTTTAPAPAAPARFVKSLKGTADVEFIEGPSKPVGNEVVTVLKVKNMSAMALSLFKVDEYWYNKKHPPEVVSGDTYKNTKPFMPGEVIEVTLKAPKKPGEEFYMSQYQFSHAGGDVKPKRVKKFE